MQIDASTTTKHLHFDDGHVRIYRGDCRAVLRSFPAESIDMVITDPPYGVGYRGRWGSDWEAITGDEESTAMLPAFAEIWRVLKPNSFCLSFYGWPDADHFLTIWKMNGYRPVSHLVFVKNNIGLGYFSRSQHETAYLLAKGRPVRPEPAASDVFPWDRETFTFHPTQKPVEAISKLIAAFCREDALILDPFMGSGTTLVAARNMGRRAIGIEIEEQYCQVAAERLAQRIFDFPSECHTSEPVMPSLFDAEVSIGEGQHE